MTSDTIEAIETENFQLQRHLFYVFPTLGNPFLFNVMCDHDQEHPIPFYSQRLTKCQKNTLSQRYNAVLVVKRFRPYVELMKFRIITDHDSLKKYWQAIG